MFVLLFYTLTGQFVDVASATASVFVGWLLCVVLVRMKARSLLLFLRKYD